jgi:hypothetical protein
MQTNKIRRSSNGTIDIENYRQETLALQPRTEFFRRMGLCPITAYPCEGDLSHMRRIRLRSQGRPVATLRRKFIMARRKFIMARCVRLDTLDDPRNTQGDRFIYGTIIRSGE